MLPDPLTNERISYLRSLVQQTIQAHSKKLAIDPKNQRIQIELAYASGYLEALHDASKPTDKRSHEKKIP